MTQIIKLILAAFLLLGLFNSPLKSQVKNQETIDTTIVVENGHTKIIIRKNVNSNNKNGHRNSDKRQNKDHQTFEGISPLQQDFEGNLIIDTKSMDSIIKMTDTMMKNLLKSKFLLDLNTSRYNNQLDMQIEEWEKLQEDIRFRHFPPGPELEREIELREDSHDAHHHYEDNSEFRVQLGFLNSNGQNGFTPVNGFASMELNQAKSFDIYFGFDRLFRILPRFYFVSGLGLDIDNYRYRNNNVFLVKNAPNLQVGIDSGSYRKSKLVATYLTLPLAFQVNFSNDASKGLHLRAGVDLSYLIGSYNKREDNNNKRRIHDDFSLDPIQINALAILGYGDFNVFFNYGLRDLFVKNQAPVQNAVSFGIVLSGIN